jgi:hypothetical protein
MPDPVRFNDSMPLSDARATLRTLVDVGHQCPCCRQFSKVYRRRLNAGMAASLVKLWAAVGERPGVFAHGPSLPGDTHEISQLAWWGLIEDEPARRTGWWAVTDFGEQWLRARTTVRSHAVVYDGRRLRLDGESLSLRQALGTKFSYEELMAPASLLSQVAA